MTRLVYLFARDDSELDVIKTADLARHCESNAKSIRERIGVCPTTPIPIKEVSDFFEMDIQTLEQSEAFANVKEDLLLLDAKDFSGAALPRVKGKTPVFLNPAMTSERRNITILEEAMHIYYNHPPSTFKKVGDKSFRTHDHLAEREAYWTAAALLLPSKVIGLSLYKRQDPRELSLRYGASIELFEFRTKILRLWNDYKQIAA